MTEIFNAFVLFGRNLFDGTTSSTILFVILIEFVVLVLALLALLILILRKKLGERRAEKDNYITSPAAPVDVKLKEIVLNTTAVQRRFVVGEDFSSRGLIVTAVYSDGSEAETSEYEVEKPNLYMTGDAFVTIRYKDAVAEYTVTVEEPEPIPEPEPEPIPEPIERRAVAIEADTSAVKTEFTVGEEFTSEGLRVIAHFYEEPYSEDVEGFTVDAPDMTVVGGAEVYVQYEGLICTYPIEIAAEVEEEPLAEPIEESIAEPVEEPLIVSPTEEIAAESEEETLVLRYDRSFTARLIRSEDNVKQWYTEIKNRLLAYKKVRDRMSWKRETYKKGRDKIALISFRGKALCLFLKLDPAEYAESKYKVEDVSANASSTETPLMYRVKSDRRAKYALQLIDSMMEKLGIPITNRESQDYYLPKEGIVELINKGLIKRKLTAEEKLFRQNKNAENAENEVTATDNGDSEVKN